MKTTSSNNNLRVSHYQHYNPGSSNCEVGPDCQLRPDVDQSGAEDPQRQKDGGGLDAEGTRQMEQMEMSWTSRVIVSSASLYDLQPFDKDTVGALHPEETFIIYHPNIATLNQRSEIFTANFIYQ